QREAARTAGQTACELNSICAGLSTVVRFDALHLHIISPTRAVIGLGPQELVENHTFKLVGKSRLARQSQQLGIQLEPSDGDAGFPYVINVRQVKVAVENFIITGRAREIN